MVIGSLDKETTNKNLLKIEKKRNIQDIDSGSSQSERRNRERSSRYCYDQKPCTSSENPQCRLNLSAVAMECDRFMLSDRAASRIVSAALEAVGLIDEDNK